MPFRRVGMNQYRLRGVNIDAGHELYLLSSLMILPFLSPPQPLLPFSFFVFFLPSKEFFYLFSDRV